MAQRYTPTKFGAPIFDDVNAAALQSDPWTAYEFNTLLIASEFSNAGAQAVIIPWILLKGDSPTGANEDLWTPLDRVVLVASVVPPHASLGPLIAGYVKAPVAQVEIPNCFQVRLLLESINAGTIKVWAGLTNRAPR